MQLNERSLRSFFLVSFFMFFCAAIFGCAHLSSTQSQHQKLPFIGSLEVQKFTLPNGLKLLVVEDHSSPTFAYQTWFRVGSRDEKVGYTGLAHLFEHMMFKETKNYKDGEFDKILERAGAEGENAFTNRDYTAYVQEMPKDKLELIIQLESDRIANLLVDEKAFKTETEVVQNERRFRNENSPDGLMYQDIFGVAFQKHSYRWPVIGYEEDLNRMGAKDAMEFYKTFYSPNHATIVVVGDVSTQEVYKLVTRYYGHLKPQAEPVHAIVSEPPQTKARHKTLKLNTQVQKIMMAYHVPEITHPDIPALTLLSSIMAGGKSSRLDRALVDSGLTTSIDIFDLDDKDPSLLILFASLQKGKLATQAERTILREFEKIKQGTIAADELERAKNILLSEFYDKFGDSKEKASFLGHYETVSPSFRTGIEILEKISRLTAADVQSAAKKYLEPSNRTVILGVQK
jgi:zinc protease